MINKVRRTTKKEDVSQTVKCKDLSYMYKRRITCISHKVYNNNLIDEIQNLLKKKEYKPGMRDCTQFVLPRPISFNLGHFPGEKLDFQRREWELPS